MSETSVIKCDVCQRTIINNQYKASRKMQMLRNFDSCDGRTFFDHLVVENIHICKACLEKVMSSGKYLIDNRVQGYGDIEVQGNE